MDVIWIIMILEIMSYAQAASGQCASSTIIAAIGQCTSSTNIVPVCTDSTDSYKQMNIPVNGGIAEGCQCDVTLVETSSETTLNRISVSNVEGVNECGYKVINYNTINNDSWTCSNSERFIYSLRLNASLQLTFTRDSTPQPTSTGFCLHITTTINNIVTNNRFTITCWRNDGTISATTKETTTPQPGTQTIRTNTKPISQTQTTTNHPTSVGEVSPGVESTAGIPASSMTSIYYGSTELATCIPNNELPAVTGIAVGVSLGFLVLIIIIVIQACIIRRKDRTYDEYVSRCTCRRSDANHHDNMYDVMTPREDNHQYEMSPARDSNATAVEVQPTYDVMENRSPENSYQTLAPPVNNGVYVNQ